MKFYVSGKFIDGVDIRKLMTALEDLGHTITCDWTGHNKNEKGYPVQFTLDDTEGVRECDTFVGRFIDRWRYSGALVELGMAIALDKKVYIIGSGADNCIFTNHPIIQHFQSELEFLSYVRQVIR